MKKLLTTIIAVLLFTCTADAAIAFVIGTQNLTRASGTGDSTHSLAATTTAGNFLLVSVTYNTSGRTVTVKDAGGNSATKIGSEVLCPASACSLDVFYFQNVTATATIVLNISGASTTANIATSEYSGIATSNALDATTSGNGSDTSPTAGPTGVTAQNSELVIGAVATSNGKTYSAGSGYGNLEVSATGANSAKGGHEDKIQSSAAAQTATFSLNSTNAWAALVATFKAAATGSASRQTLLQVGP